MAVFLGFRQGARALLADEHPEPGLECRDTRLGAANIWSIIDGHPACGLLEANVGLLGDTVVATVSSFKIKDCRPVIGEILRKGTGRAGCERRRWSLGVHGDVEGILDTWVSFDEMA